MSTVHFRLKQLRGDIPQAKFASDLGVAQTTFGRWERGEGVPDLEFAQTLCSKLGVSPQWLLTGDGPVYDPKRTTIEPARAEILRAGEPIKQVIVNSDDGDERCVASEDDLQWMAPEAAPSMGYALVPKVMARLAAGTGSLETEGKVIGYYAFKLDFLTRKGRPKKMVLMDVAGDSMEPDVWNGDTVLIDESQREIIAGAMFAVGIENEVFVKYLLRVPGKLVLKSKNPEYDPIEVDMNGDLAGTVRVIGRVVWSCREYVR